MNEALFINSLMSWNVNSTISTSLSHLFRFHFFSPWTFLPPFSIYLYYIIFMSSIMARGFIFYDNYAYSSLWGGPAAIANRNKAGTQHKIVYWKECKTMVTLISSCQRTTGHTVTYTNGLELTYMWPTWKRLNDPTVRILQSQWRDAVLLIRMLVYNAACRNM